MQRRTPEKSLRLHYPPSDQAQHYGLVPPLIQMRRGLPAFGVSELRFDLECQAGAIDKPLDQAIAHGSSGSPDSAWDFRRVAQQADRAFADHFRRRSITEIAIALHGDAELAAIGSKADEQEIVQAGLAHLFR